MRGHANEVDCNLTAPERQPNSKLAIGTFLIVQQFAFPPTNDSRRIMSSRHHTKPAAARRLAVLLISGSAAMAMVAPAVGAETP